MHILMKRSALPALVAAASLIAIWAGCGEDSVLTSDPVGTVEVADASEGATLAIGPVAGLTTAWHRNPGRAAVPVGTTVRFRCKASADDEVTWSTADEVSRDETASIAEYRFDTVGEHRILVIVETDGGGGRDGGGGDPETVGSQQYSCVLNVVDETVEGITVRSVQVSAPPLEIDDNSTSMETMLYFFAAPTIAHLSRVSESYYRTSTKNPVTINAQVEASFSDPLIEWRIDGKPSHLGTGFRRMINVTGLHRFSIGPPARALEIDVEAYRVTIISHTTGEDVIEGQGTVTFSAVTDPPGFEDEIRWMSSTWYGSATPRLGEGPSFTVSFDGTWRPDGNFQWLGVRADNAMFHQELEK